MSASYRIPFDNGQEIKKINALCYGNCKYLSNTMMDSGIEKGSSFQTFEVIAKPSEFLYKQNVMTYLDHLKEMFPKEILDVNHETNVITLDANQSGNKVIGIAGIIRQMNERPSAAKLYYDIFRYYYDGWGSKFPAIKKRALLFLCSNSVANISMDGGSIHSISCRSPNEHDAFMVNRCTKADLKRFAIKGITTVGEPFNVSKTYDGIQRSFCGRDYSDVATWELFPNKEMSFDEFYTLVRSYIAEI